MEGNLNPANEAELGYGQLFSMLLRRSTWFLVVFCSTLAIAALYTIVTKPIYKSSMQLLVEPNYQSRGLRQDNGDNFQSDKQNEIDYATQLNLMRSRQFVEQATNKLRQKYPDITAKAVQQRLTLSQTKNEDKAETKMIDVVYLDDDPVKTQEMLKAFQALYEKYNAEQQKVRLVQGSSIIDGELKSVRQQLTQSQGALEEFRKSQNLIDPGQQATAVTTLLNTVVSNQQDLQAQYRDAQARDAKLQQQLAQSPRSALIAARLSESSRFQTLLGEWQKTELELAQRRAIFTDSDQGVKNLSERQQNQLALLHQEAERVLGGAVSEVDLTGNTILNNGQLGATDLTLVGDLVKAETDLSSLTARSQSLAQTEQNLRQELNRFPELMAEYDRLQPEVDIQRTVLQQLLEERQKLSADLARGGFNWQVVEAPQLGDKISPKTKQSLLLGAVAGLFLGGIAAFLREAIDGVIHQSDEFKRLSQVPLLGTLPDFSTIKSGRAGSPFKGKSAQQSRLLQALGWLPFRESLDLTYQNIQFLNRQTPPKSLVIASALAEEGKTTLVLGLAFSAARLHQRVLVIDADLRGSDLPEQLGVANEQGLSTLLQGGRLTHLSIRHLTLSDSSIDLLTSGPAPIDPVKLISSQAMKNLIVRFESEYDLILIDAPPALGLVDVLQVASLCDGVVMVGRLDRVTRSDLESSIAMLKPFNLLGMVVNGSKTYPSQYANMVRNDLLLQTHTVGDGNHAHPEVLQE